MPNSDNQDNTQQKLHLWIERLKKASMEGVEEGENPSLEQPSSSNSSMPSSSPPPQADKQASENGTRKVPRLQASPSFHVNNMRRGTARFTNSFAEREVNRTQFHRDIRNAARRNTDRRNRSHPFGGANSARPRIRRNFSELFPEDRYHLQLDKVIAAEKKMKKIKENRRVELKEHLAKVLPEQKKSSAYHLLSQLEKNIYKALVKWFRKQMGPPPNGILELRFHDTKLKETNFEPIEGEIDSTVKIKKLKASDKVKEMLLALKRGKNIFMDFYKKDLTRNIFTFMILNGQLQSNQKCRETAKVIEHFKKFGSEGIPYSR